MTIFNWHSWHNWEPITEYDEYEFEGKILKREVNTKYRRCKECTKYQKIFMTLGGTSWDDLTDQEIVVVYDKYVVQIHTREKPKFNPPPMTPKSSIRPTETRIIW